MPMSAVLPQRKERYRRVRVVASARVHENAHREWRRRRGRARAQRRGRRVRWLRYQRKAGRRQCMRI